MQRIIINIDDGIDLDDAVSTVSAVMGQGRISRAHGKDHFCWHSCYSNKLCVGVSVKYGTDTDTFHVSKYETAHLPKQ